MIVPPVRSEIIADPRGLPKIARKGSGKGGGGASPTSPAQHQPTESPNTLVSRQSARIIEVLSEGVIFGMHTSSYGGPFWAGVYADDTPLQDAAGNWNFNVLQLDFRYGYPSQDPIPGFPLSESEYSVGIASIYLVPIVRALTDPNITTVRITLQIPALYTQESDGDVIPSSVAYAFDVQIDGGFWTNVITERLQGKTMSPYYFQRLVSLPAATTSINIRIIRLDFNNVTDNANELVWSSYTEIVDGQISYDDTSVVAMTVTAQEFPNLPQRSYLIDGIMVQLPNNYDPRTHGLRWPDWDGTFYIQWTNNPAWILYSLLTNERWGVGRDINASAVDKWSFYHAQQINDYPCSDGQGGIEPRWTCNCVINTRQDAWQVLAAVASSMLATLYFANGTIFLVQDYYIDAPSRMFGPENIEDGLFSYVGTDVRSRWTAVPVGWVDPDDKYQAAVELVQDPTLVATQGYREAPQQQAFGCTSRSQAIRMGRWFIYTSQFETETVTFTVGLENADLRPGDYIAISDPSRVGQRLAGRLLEDNGADTITLDNVPDVILNSPQFGWSIYVTVGSAAYGAGHHSIYSLPLMGLPATPDSTQLHVAGKPAPNAFPPASTWMAVSTTYANPTPWRVNSVTDKGAGKYEIMATEYHNEKFDYVDNGWLRPTPPTSLLPKGPLLGPTNVTHTEYIYRDASGIVQFGVILSWTASNDPRVSNYQIEMAGPRGEYKKFGLIQGVVQDVPAMSQGPWIVQLRAFDNIGRRSGIVEYDFTPIGLTAKPVAPTALYITPQGGNLSTLIWTATGEIDVAYYWVKWTGKTTGATWERATTSIAQVDYNTTQINTPTRSGTFMVKTIDSLGQESDGWAEAILEQQQTETSIFFDEHQQPAWAGDLGATYSGRVRVTDDGNTRITDDGNTRVLEPRVQTVWHRNLDELWLPPPLAPEPVPPGVFPGDRATALNQTPTRVGVYGFDVGFDLGASTLVTMTGYVEGYGTRLGVVMAQWLPIANQVPLAQGAHNSMSNWIPLASAAPLATGGSPAWDAHIEARVSQDGVIYADWFPLKSTVITGQAFEWRMVGSIYDLQTTLRVVEAGVLIEVPLRSVQGSDKPLDGTGHLAVTYAAPFLVTPTVQLTARQSLQPGGNIVIVESDRDHFMVENRDASGAPHAGGSIDYFVQGYGGHA
jgi:predicted phage tail protein